MIQMVQTERARQVAFRSAEESIDSSAHDPNEDSSNSTSATAVAATGEVPRPNAGAWDIGPDGKKVRAEAQQQGGLFAVKAPSANADSDEKNKKQNDCVCATNAAPFDSKIISLGPSMHDDDGVRIETSTGHTEMAAGECNHCSFGQGLQKEKGAVLGKLAEGEICRCRFRSGGEVPLGMNTFEAVDVDPVPGSSCCTLPPNSQGESRAGVQRFPDRIGFLVPFTLFRQFSRLSNYIVHNCSGSGTAIGKCEW